MKTDPTFLAAGSGLLTRAQCREGEWQVETILEDVQVNCLGRDPLNPHRVYAGTQHHGLLRSDDQGRTWQAAGLTGIPVKSLALSPHRPGWIYAGCKPVSLYRTQDDARTWTELPGLREARKWWWFSPAEPPDWRPYVMAMTISPADPQIIMAGIEFGGVLRSGDGGLTWSGHPRGALRDCHSLTFHPTDGAFVYQGGAGGASLSRDGGRTWRKHRRGLDRTYGWKVNTDPARPEVCYLSAGKMPNLLRGEFQPPAHVDGRANAAIYRSVDGGPWTRLSGGLPEPLDYMAYALVTDPLASGHLYAGLSNGQVWHTSDFGDSWRQLPFQLNGIHHSMLII